MSNAMRKRLKREIQRMNKKARAIETKGERSFFKWLAKVLKKQGAGIKLE